MKKYSLYLVLSSLLVILLLQVDHTHIISGDFSLYLRQSVSILNGDASEIKEYMQFMLTNSGNDLFSPVLYPWGIPILLSPIIFIFGLNFLAIKIYLVLFFIGSLFFLGKIYQTKKLSHITVMLLVLLVGMQPEYFKFLNYILSEMPYFFFVMLSIWSINRYIVPSSPNRRSYLCFIGIGVLLMFTAQIRTEGILLFIALLAKQAQILYQLYIQKELSINKLKTGALYLSPYFAGLLFYIIINILPSGFMHHAGHLDYVEPYRVLLNILGFFKKLQNFLPFSNSIKVLVLLIFASIGMFVTFKKAIVESVFVLAAIMIIIIWPFQSTRHLFTVFPFIVYFSIAGIHYFIPEKRRELCSQLILVFLLVILISSPNFIKGTLFPDRDKQKEQYDKRSIEQDELVEFVEQNIPADDVIAFAHSRWLLLHTNRKIISSWGSLYMTKMRAEWYIYCISGGKYFQHSGGELTSKPEIFKEVFRNDFFIAYKIVE